VFPSVGLALLAAWLALPQGTMPDYLPLPLLSSAELAAASAEQRLEARQARQHPLDYSARTVGEAFRQLGRLVHNGEPIDVERRDRFRAFVGQARHQVGDAPIRQLRAIQTELFLAALKDWENTGVEGDDLIELGGDFLTVATELGWVKLANHEKLAPVAHNTKPCLELDEYERAALFLARWTDLAGMTEDATLHLQSVWPLLALRSRLRLPLSKLGARDLSLVERVKRLSPRYPDRLSQGLIYARLGDMTQAIAAYRAHLAANPDGPYTLRARNHLRYALEKMANDGD
jgi:tetratricopeptide (TPR) repeat protein